MRDLRGRLVQVRVAEITRLVGADDYVELHVGDRSYPVKVTLNEFEQRLDPNHFRRVHRSVYLTAPERKRMIHPATTAAIQTPSTKPTIIQKILR